MRGTGSELERAWKTTETLWSPWDSLSEYGTAGREFKLIIRHNNRQLSSSWLFGNKKGGFRVGLALAYRISFFDRDGWALWFTPASAHSTIANLVWRVRAGITKLHGGGWHSGLPKDTCERIGYISYGSMVSAILPKEVGGGTLGISVIHICVSDISIPYLAVQEEGSVTRPTKQVRKKL